GTVTIYGLDPNAAPELSTRSAQGGVECDRSHMAPENICNAVISAVANQKGNDPINDSPRSVCVEGSGQTSGKCCISWSKPIWDGHFRDLVNGALDIKTTCAARNGGQVSGLIRGIQIGETWTTECVSNRPTSC
ncbi:hypothetical protein BGZ63DRAFT_337904, partial [Mariannaea sp. PMI_226]